MYSYAWERLKPPGSGAREASRATPERLENRKREREREREGGLVEFFFVVGLRWVVVIEEGVGSG
jgi:hypothetical protein